MLGQAVAVVPTVDIILCYFRLKQISKCVQLIPLWEHLGYLFLSVALTTTVKIRRWLFVLF